MNYYLYNFLQIGLRFSVGLPLVGEITGVSSAKRSVKKTLSNVEIVLKYVRIFLVVFSIVLAIILLLWGIKLLKKRIALQKMRKTLKLLHRVQADLVILKEGTVDGQGDLTDVEMSKKDIFMTIRNSLGDPYFEKNLGVHVHKRIVDSIDLILDGKISLQNQTILVAQWIKIIGLLCR